MVRAGIGWVLATLLFVSWRSVTGTANAGAALALMATFAGIGFFAPQLLAWLRTPRGEAERIFALTVSLEDFLVEATGVERLTIPLDTIETFQGGARLSIIRRDGSTTSLPCCLAAGSHDNLAAQLNDLLAKARGSTARHQVDRRK